MSGAERLVVRAALEGVPAAGTPQDMTDPRAKNEPHGKVTADKWNQ